MVTALGAALLANPQVRAWVEEQRRKIAEALRSLGDELDPQSRRQAEAFAFEGRIPGQRPEVARRESAAAKNAALKATGREGVDLDETTRRLTRTGSGITSSKLGEEEEAERRRLGREYLARRNQEMMDAKEKAKLRKSAASLASSSANLDTTAEKAATTTKIDTTTDIGITAEKDTPIDVPHPTNPLHQMAEIVNPWSFDNLVDENGSLKPDNASEPDMEKTLELPSPPTDEPKSLGRRKIAISESVQPAAEMALPVRVTGFDAGSRWANPFGDEFELEDTGYATPRPQAPAIPPKIALDPEISVPEPEPQPQSSERAVQSESSDKGKQPAVAVREIPIQQDDEALDLENMSYEEQLARVLSLSLADDQKIQKATDSSNRSTQYEEELAATINLSLREEKARMYKQEKKARAHRLEQATQKMSAERDRARARIVEKNEQRRSKLAQPKQDAEYDAELAAAIEASIHEEKARTDKSQQAIQKMNAKLEHAREKIAAETDQNRTEMTQLANITLDPPVSVPQQHDAPRTPTMNAQIRSHEELEDLYSISPEFYAKRAAHTVSRDVKSLPEATKDDLEDLYGLSPEYQANRAAKMISPLDISDSKRGQAETSDTFGPFTSSSSGLAAGNKSNEDNLIDLSSSDIRNEDLQAQSLARPAPSHEEQMQYLKTSYRTQPELGEQHRHVSNRLAAYAAEVSQKKEDSEMPATTQPVSEVTPDLVHHTTTSKDSEGAHTPTTATVSPSVERDSIGFATDSEDEFASAAGSFVQHAAAEHERPESSSSFVAEPENAQNDFSETESLVGHSEAESVSVVDADEEKRDEAAYAEVESATEDSDEEWESGVRTPGSEWTDVGSQVSEEEVGGQDSSRLIKE